MIQFSQQAKGKKMKFSILRSKFLEGLKAVQGIVGTKSQLQVLQNVLLEVDNNKLVMTTTDLEISITSISDCTTIESGKTTLPVKLLFNFISKVVEGNVEIAVDENNRATISAGSANFKLSGIEESAFPRLPVKDENFIYKLPQATLKEMLRQTAYAASQDDTRRTLKGVLMSFKDSKLTMVATDGRRLAMVEQEVEFPKDSEIDVILPFKAVQELQKSLTSDEEVTVKIEKSQISFSLGSISIYSKLIDEKYPNYNQVIPKECNEQIHVDRQLLLDALERASVITKDETHSTKLVFESNCLTVNSAASDVGEAKDEVPIKYAGEKIEIMFNPDYIMDPLKAIDDDEVTINLINGHSPAMIKCSIPFLYVIMPLRAN